MKRFMVKTILLMAALFICVIYGMEVAKSNMMNMVGEKPNHSLSLAQQLSKPLPTPSVSSHSTSSGTSTTSKSSSAKQTSTVSKKSASGQASNGNSDELTKRIHKLQTIQDFNPYGSMGEGLSNGFQKTFLSGMTATTNLFDQIMNHVF